MDVGPGPPAGGRFGGRGGAAGTAGPGHGLDGRRHRALPADRAAAGPGPRLRAGGHPPGHKLQPGQHHPQHDLRRRAGRRAVGHLHPGLRRPAGHPGRARGVAGHLGHRQPLGGGARRLHRPLLRRRPGGDRRLHLPRPQLGAAGGQPGPGAAGGHRAAALVRPPGRPLRLHRPAHRAAQHPPPVRGPHVGADRQQRGLHRRAAVVRAARQLPVAGRGEGPPQLAGPARSGDHRSGSPSRRCCSSSRRGAPASPGCTGVWNPRHEAVRQVARLGGWTFGFVVANQLCPLRGAGPGRAGRRGPTRCRRTPTPTRSCRCPTRWWPSRS